MYGGLSQLIILFMFIDYSTAKLEDLETRIYRLELLIDKQNERIQHQEVEIIQLKIDLVNNQKSDHDKDKEIATLKESVAKLSIQCASGNEDVKIDELAGNNKREKEKYKRLISDSIVPIEVLMQRFTAFYAYMSKIDVSPGNGHTLKFDVVKTNINGGYNPSSGVFTVPTDGVYVFTFSIRLHSGDYGAYEIVKNAEVEGVAVGIIDRSSTSTQVQTTETIVLSAKKGDIVFLRIHLTLGHSGDIWTNEHGRTLFAGWQISD
ncbi:C1QL [Mytilus edulis]|uniref:C1QL n=1 Tax=Mytilus edulis TaxID=6550 RepID=A0A8S3RCN6_MYTED|nr:C1QL [Mytilus edulis]